MGIEVLNFFFNVYQSFSIFVVREKELNSR